MGAIRICQVGDPILPIDNGLVKEISVSVTFDSTSLFDLLDVESFLPGQDFMMLVVKLLL
jgi:hypothetical protein